MHFTARHSNDFAYRLVEVEPIHLRRRFLGQSSKGLIDIMSDRGGQFPQRRHARHVCQLRLRFLQMATNANAALRWLSSDSPNLLEAHEAIRRIVRDGDRAGKIIDGVRALAKKAPPKMGWLDLNETIGEVAAMARSEVQRNRVLLQTRLANDLPLISGDKIQLQQVILNLLINAIEAMSGAGEGPRKLEVSTQKAANIDAESKEERSEDGALTEVAWTHVLITVRDSGPGLDPKSIDRLFDTFYTTKPEGLGMGLGISRSIIAAHGGSLWAKANAPRGAVFQFTLPIGDKRIS